MSIKLFNTDRSVGQMFTMYGQQFTVIGVVKTGANPVNYNTIETRLRKLSSKRLCAKGAT